MPLVWLGLPPALPPLPPVTAQEISLAEELTIQFRSSRYDAETDTYTFSDGVTARLGPTTITADRLILERGAGRGRAEGQVRITDPEGFVTTNNAEFTLDAKGRLLRAETGELEIRVAGVRLAAKSALIEKESWTFQKVSFTNCIRKTPVYEVHMPELRIQPGRRGRAKTPTLEVLGARLLSLPTQTFLLDRRVIGIKYPSLTYRRDEGTGVQWESGILAGPNASITAAAAAFPRSFPSVAVRYSESRGTYSERSGLIAPRSELAERFSEGYFDRVTVRKPADEQAAQGEARRVWSVGSEWNQRPAARTTEPAINKHLEVTFEQGGSFGAREKPGFDLAERSWGYLGQARLQSIRAVGEASHVRGLLTGSVHAPTAVLTPGVESLVRFDALASVGNQNYGWVRAQLGLVVRPIRQVTLGAAWVGSAESGRALFGFDRLYSAGGLHLRGDLDLGPTQLRLLWKWDKHRKWYDREYEASQVVGCFEPFVVYRQFPGDYRLGLRFRLDDFQALLRRREIRRGDSKAPLPQKRLLIE